MGKRNTEWVPLSKPPRKAVAVSTVAMSNEDGMWIVTTAVCSDGTIWRKGLDDTWVQMDEIPG